MGDEHNNDNPSKLIFVYEYYHIEWASQLKRPLNSHSIKNLSLSLEYGKCDTELSIVMHIIAVTGKILGIFGGHDHPRVQKRSQDEYTFIVSSSHFAITDPIL